jgi:hypothetical protein
MLQGKFCCICELCTLDQTIGAKPLPRNLLLQMDNCVKDNKNRHLLTFLSLGESMNRGIVWIVTIIIILEYI